MRVSADSDRVPQHTRELQLAPSCKGTMSCCAARLEANGELDRRAENADSKPRTM